MAVTPVPEGFHTVTPYLTVVDASALIDFMTRAFGGTESRVMRRPDGSVWHADVVIGGLHVMCGQAPDRSATMPSMLYLYVPDADAAYRRALASGATSISEPATQFYGNRHGAVRDCCGNA